MIDQLPSAIARRLQQTPADTGAAAADSVRAGAQGFEWSQILRREELIPDLIDVGIIIVLALVGFRVLTVLARRMEREIEEPDPLVKRRREQRMQTLAGLVRNVGSIAIVTIAGMMILDTFVPIGPLLAAAGILGLAVSFGAQSLVKDVISGAFILMEGQFGVGDVIRVAGTAGLVERVTLRTTVLRDINGIVHIFPNGEITAVSNLTKGWSRALIDVGVAYKEDVDHVIEVLGEVGREFYDDPEWGPLILEAPEVPGVEQFADSAVVVRIMAKTLPLKQWDVQRELRRRIKKRFDAEGIEIPFPHRTVYWGGGQKPGDGSAPHEHPDAGTVPHGMRTRDDEG